MNWADVVASAKRASRAALVLKRCQFSDGRKIRVASRVLSTVGVPRVPQIVEFYILWLSDPSFSGHSGQCGVIPPLRARRGLIKIWRLRLRCEQCPASAQADELLR